jgi:GNAT superfamily N-acetyltransferase
VERAEIPEPVRRQALHPFLELPSPPGCFKVERGAFTAGLHPMPIAQVVDPGELEPAVVGAAIAEARAVVRAHGRSLLAWLVGPEHRWLGPELARHGLVHADTPGFEAIENAMALVRRPDANTPGGVVVALVTSFEDYAASQQVTNEAFEMPEEMREDMKAALPERYAEYETPGNPLRQFIATLEGRVVGSAAAGLGPAGVNLFGGAVRADARGRGVYRALVLARWELAVAQGTPALTVQAGRMSMPILERLGFELVDTIDVYVDEF